VGVLNWTDEICKRGKEEKGDFVASVSDSKKKKRGLENAFQHASLLGLERKDAEVLTRMGVGTC